MSSGHIADVGFDLYVRLVGEASRGAQSRCAGAGDEETPEVKIELPITAHLPEQYVPAERLLASRRTRTAKRLQRRAGGRRCC